MRKTILLGAILFALFGCEQYQSTTKKLNAYFDLDSLLDAQVQLLATQNATLTKTVIKDGEEESRTFQPDSAQWQEEFSIIRDYNLNKPHNVGAYKTNESAKMISYKAEASRKLSINNFEVILENGEVKQINSQFSESKYIYSTERTLNMTFEKGQLQSYKIDGNQKMILLDAVNYQIAGIIK